MADAFDNRKFVPGRQQIFHSASSPSLVNRDIQLNHWERSSSPQLLSSLSRSNQSSPSFETNVFNKTLTNHQHSKLSTSNDSSYYQKQQQQPVITGRNLIHFIEE